jgi:hypothetical protein
VGEERTFAVLWHGKECKHSSADRRVPRWLPFGEGIVEGEQIDFIPSRVELCRKLRGFAGICGTAARIVGEEQREFLEL